MASARKGAERISRLTRALQPMPPFVQRALRQRGLMEAYRSRPAYQQNDYLGWITGAKREETQRQRLAQMLDELERGDVYMNMAWRAGDQRERRAQQKAGDEPAFEDFERALRANPAAGEAWERLAPSHRREHLDAIEEAKRPDTRVRRIERAVELLSAGQRRPVAAASARSLGMRLQLRPGMALAVLGAPSEPAELLGALPEGVTIRRSLGRAPGAVLLFVRDHADFARRFPPVAKAATSDNVVWVAYPKSARGVATDLNRDVLAQLMRDEGWQPVSQVAVDATWSALRCRRR